MSILKNGDVVRLRSGGRRFVVSNHGPKSSGMVNILWEFGGKVCIEYVEVATLRKCIWGVF